MKQPFAFTRTRLAILLTLFGYPTWAIEPFPALPPTLSTSVTPNIMLYIDTSGSMLQSSSNGWMRNDLCTMTDATWANCVNKNTNKYRSTIDDPNESPNTKMNIAKRVAKNIINDNRNLRFGLFTFQDNPENIGGSERAQAGKLRRQITDINESNQGDYDALITAIDNMRGRTATPLGEGLLEITRYFEGKSSLYETYSGNYISPIQYRCQKNFAIIITDGEATGEDNLPGSGKNALSYTARDRDGKAVSKYFTVCTNSNSTIADGTSVTCPDNLEGSSTSTVFGDTNNRSRAVRDVAMYANVADLRVGGKDLDGVDFDDPKFSKQNLNT